MPLSLDELVAANSFRSFRNCAPFSRVRGLRANLLVKTVAILISLIGSVPSLAQTSIPLPPEKFEMAPGGVDMRTGRYVYTKTDLSIGDPSQGSGLALTRTLPSFVPEHTTNPMANFTHNWDVALEIRGVDLNGTLSNGNFPPGNDFEAFVNYNGRTQTFTSPYGSIGYGSQSKLSYSQLTFTGGRMTASSVYYFTDSFADTIKFEQLGTVNGLAITGFYPTAIGKPNGTTITYNYTAFTDASGNHAVPQSIVSSFGYAILFEYSGGFVSKACALNLAAAPIPANKLCPAGAQSVSYAYTGAQLTSVTDAALAIASFQYGTSGGANTMGFVKPGMTTPWLINTTGTTYDELGGSYDFVTSQSFADGQSYVYTYQHPPIMTGRVLVKMGGSFTNALGEKTTATYSFPALPRPTCSHPPCAPPTMGSTVYQITPGPTMVTEPLNRITVNDYCSPLTTQFCDVQTLQSATSPEGIKIMPTFDNYNNITSLVKVPKPGSGLSQTTISATYDCFSYPKSCNKPTSNTDAKGNVSTYIYDPVHGGILTATGPAVLVNGTGSPVAPVRRYAYVQRYAWVSNGSGGYVQGASQMWLLASEKTCRSTATVSGACAGGVTDEVTTVYEYGPDTGLVGNNLQLRGTAVTADIGGTMTTLRTCVAYDPLGRKISETKPAGTTLLSACP